jgi:predicted transcriptional regulator
MAMRTQTMVQLTDDLLELLDERAARMGVSRSQVIRDAIEAYLQSDRAAAIDRQIVEGYTRMPQGGQDDADEWGDLATMMTALTMDQLRQLTADERDSGFQSW